MSGFECVVCRRPEDRSEPDSCRCSADEWRSAMIEILSRTERSARERNERDRVNA